MYFVLLPFLAAFLWTFLSVREIGVVQLAWDIDCVIFFLPFFISFLNVVTQKCDVSWVFLPFGQKYSVMSQFNQVNCRFLLRRTRLDQIELLTWQVTFHGRSMDLTCLARVIDRTAADSGRICGSIRSNGPIDSIEQLHELWIGYLV